MNVLYPNAVVITGGPGVGKSTLLDLLNGLGHRVLPEVARLVIEESQRNSRDLHPATRLADFQYEVARRIIEQEEVLAESQRVHFLDRGLVDGIGYCTQGCIPVPRIVSENARNRYGMVIILDPLPNYKRDEARWEDPEHARQIHDCITEAYRGHGYQPIMLPAIPIDERLERVLELVNC